MMENRNGTQFIQSCGLLSNTTFSYFSFVCFSFLGLSQQKQKHQQWLKTTDICLLLILCAANLQSNFTDILKGHVPFRILRGGCFLTFSNSLGSQVSGALWGHHCFHCHMIFTPPCLSFHSVLFLVYLYPNCIAFIRLSFILNEAPFHFRVTSS